MLRARCDAINDRPSRGDNVVDTGCLEECTIAIRAAVDDEVTVGQEARSVVLTRVRLFLWAREGWQTLKS